jgi:outer membrane protein TolC
MRVKSPCVRVAVTIAATLCLFASGPAVSAFGQDKPATPAAQVPPARPAGATATPTSTLRIGSDEAVRLALENNLGIQTERLNPQLQTLTVSRALSVYTPELFGRSIRSSDTSPPRDFLSQGVAVTSSGSTTGLAGVRQNLRWFGSSYSLGWSALRSTSNAPRTPFSPQLGSDVDLSFTQPLLRNFTIDALRQNIAQSRVQLQIADIQLAQRITQTSRTVRNAYFNLISAISSLEVAEQSLELARQSLRDNRRRVEVGTMAPIEITESEAEVARQEDTVISRRGAIESAEDILRALILNPSQPDFWTVKIEPSDQPVLAPRPVDVDAAVRNALANRTDLIQLKKQIESVDLDIKYNQNQKLPNVDVTAAYGLTGIGGTQNIYGPDPGDGTPPAIARTSSRNFADVLHDVFGNDFRSWSLTFNVSYPIGSSQADVALASSRLQRQQAQVNQRQMEIGITTQVREAARDVSTSLQRVEATRKAREFAERRLDAENKRVGVGLSDTFRLLTAQRDLASAKQAELTAIIDYNRALINLEAIQTVPPGAGF